MLVAFARPEVHELFPRLWADRSLQELNLGELSHKASERLVRHVLGERATDDVVASVLDRAGGNAFYLEELMRGVADGNDAALPETVLAMVQARLEALSPETRRVLRAASVYGQRFWFDGVRALLGGDTRAGTLEPALAELVEREVIATRDDVTFAGERAFVFRHAFLREAAYAMLTEHDRALGHKLAASWLESRGERDAVVLGEHFERGGEPARAVAWYARAAGQALEGNDFPAAVRIAERAVACGASGNTLGELRRIEAEAHKWSGSLAETERLGREALTLLQRGSSSWCSAAGEVVAAVGRRGHHDMVAEIANDLIESARLDGLSPPVVICLARAGVQLLLAGHPSAQFVFDTLDAVDAEKLAADDPAAAAHLSQMQSMRASVAGEPMRYIARSEAAQVLFDRAGDLRNGFAQRGRVAYARMGLGDYARAAEGYRDAIRDAERVGVLSAVNYARHNLGLALLRLGALDEALVVEREALTAAVAQSDPRLEGACRMYLAQIHVARGEFDDAEREAREAVAVVEPTPPLRVPALATLAEVLLARDKLDEARGVAIAGVAQLDALHQVDEGQMQVLLVDAETLEAQGDRPAARTAIARARDALLARATKIQNPEARTAFLDRIPEHERILACAREWIDEATSEVPLIR
jgi:tetratricopeptide (TPR) repeat protein